MTTSTTGTTGTTTTGAHIDSLETVGQFFPYNPTAAPTAHPGHRVVTCTYKQTEAMKKKGIDARDNVYVQLPVHLTLQMLKDNIDDIAPAVIQMLQQVEDTRIKAAHKAGIISIYPESLTLSSILADLEDQGISTLSGSLISEWFAEHLARPMTEALITANKLDKDNLGDEVEAKLIGMVETYHSRFVALASGKTKPFPKEREELTKAITLASMEDSAIGAKLLAKFAKQTAEEEASIADLGGDLVGL